MVSLLINCLFFFSKSWFRPSISPIETCSICNMVIFCWKFFLSVNLEVLHLIITICCCLMIQSVMAELTTVRHYLLFLCFSGSWDLIYYFSKIFRHKSYVIDSSWHFGQYFFCAQFHLDYPFVRCWFIAQYLFKRGFFFCGDRFMEVKK